MSEQPPSSGERREALQESRDYAGLQARLLTGEPRNFDPSADLSTLQAENFPDTPSHAVVNTASSNERRAAWQGKPGNLEERKQQWAQSMVDFFTRQKQKENGTYYDTAGKRELEFFQRLGSKMGIAIDPRNFTPEAAMAIYGRYFGGDRQVSAMDKFVNDVLIADLELVAQDASIPDEHKDAATWDLIRNDYQYIEMFGKIFGSKSGKVAAELTLATVKKSLDGGEKLVEQMRVQNPSAGEQELLQFLWEKGARALVEAQQNPARLALPNPNTAGGNEEQQRHAAIEQILQRPVQGDALDAALLLRAELGGTLPPEFTNNFQPLIDRLTNATSPEDQRLILQEVIRRTATVTGDVTQMAVAGELRQVATEQLAKLEQPQPEPQREDPQVTFRNKLESIVASSRFDGGRGDKIKPLINELKAGVSLARQQEIMRQIDAIAVDMANEFSRGKSAWTRAQVHYASQLQQVIDAEAMRLAQEQAAAQQERARDTGPLTPEQLREMIKVGAVDNYGRGGYEFWKDTVLHDKVLNVVFSQERNMDISSNIGVDSNVRMIGVPIRNFPPEVVTGIASGQHIEPTDVALCFSFSALDVDNYHRNGMFRGLTIMSEANAKRFTDNVQQDPTLLFSLLREANGGYIRRQDGTPVAIDQGERIAILPNARLGGEVNDLTTSQPFPENYTPNPGPAAEQSQPQQPEVAQPEQQAGAEPQIDPIFAPLQQAVAMLRQRNSITDPVQQASLYAEAYNLLSSANVWNENAMTLVQQRQREQLVEQMRAEIDAYAAAHPVAETTPPAPVENAPEISRVQGIGFIEDQGRRRTMEDAHTVIENFGGRSDQAFFGIFDGHGGRFSADTSAARLHEFFLGHLQAGLDPKEALRQAYLDTDKFIEEQPGYDDGATAITAFVQGGKLYVANAGDARGVLDSDGRAVRLSYDHKTSDPREQARVRSLGGVIIPVGGVDRIQGEIAVARALGDKRYGEYVSPEPYISEEDLGPEDRRVILACDGLWDVISDQEAIYQIQNEPNPQRASEILRDLALQRGSTDNISVLVVNLSATS